MTTTTITATAEDQALKAKHAAIWASGSYRTVVDEIVGSLGGILVEDADVQRGQRVLDVAAGTGSSALPASRRGAEVTATDLTPELLDVGRAAAADAGLEITWQTADAEALPYNDAEFDVVLSCIGVMFAPHHQQAADELVRVCRPGGTIGVLSWTPEGFIGQVFAVMKPYAPPPPPGASPAPLWGRADHVHGLFGDRLTDLVARQQSLPVDRFTDGVEFREFMKRNYGPTIAGLPLHRRRSVQGRGTRRGPGCAGRAVPRGREHALGIPAGDRSSGMRRTDACGQEIRSQNRADLLAAPRVFSSRAGRPDRRSHPEVVLQPRV